MQYRLHIADLTQKRWLEERIELAHEDVRVVVVVGDGREDRNVVGKAHGAQRGPRAVSRAEHEIVRPMRGGCRAATCAAEIK